MIREIHKTGGTPGSTTLNEISMRNEWFCDAWDNEIAISREKKQAYWQMK